MEKVIIYEFISSGERRWNTHYFLSPLYNCLGEGYLFKDGEFLTKEEWDALMDPEIMGFKKNSKDGMGACIMCKSYHRKKCLPDFQDNLRPDWEPREEDL